MIKRLKKLKDLPYKSYSVVLLKDESRLDKADELGFEGYSFITSTPKMVMLYIEYVDGIGTKIGKDIWNLL